MEGKKIKKKINDAIKINDKIKTTIISEQKNTKTTKELVKTQLSAKAFIKILKESAVHPSLPPPEDDNGTK